MKIVLIAALVSSLYLVAIEATKLENLPGHHNNLRPALGHFKIQPFHPLYTLYATYLTNPPHSHERDADDYRNYLPSGDECMRYFSKFRIAEYKVSDFDELVILDACLGYLYESEFHEQDKAESQQLQENLDAYINDEQLRYIYEGVIVEQFPSNLQTCIADFLTRMILAKNQFPNVVCNDHIVQLYVQFADCAHEQIQATEQYKSDAYVKVIYDLFRERAEPCVQTEVGRINRAVRQKYKDSIFYRTKLGLMSKLSHKAHYGQSKERMYPDPIVKLLSVVQGRQASFQVNLKLVASLLYGVVDVKDPIYEKRLFDNVAEAANSQINVKKNDKRFPHDSYGQERFSSWIDGLCNYFRTSDNDKLHDYAMAITRLLRLVRHEDVFGVSQRHFVQLILNQSYESGPLYLSVSSCNLLTYLDGTLQTPVSNGEQRYQVKFKPNTSNMARWPTSGFF